VIVDHDKCKPKSPAFQYLARHAGGCGKECIKVAGKQIIIDEEACAACCNRATKCPGGAVSIVKIPTNMTTDTTHHFGPNMFKLHGLPQPRPGHVLGLLGSNGIGKSTALKVLCIKQKPNLGLLDESTKWADIIHYYRGSDLQNYFIKLLTDEAVPAMKPQMDTYAQRPGTGRKVRDVIEKNSQRGERVAQDICEKLELNHLMDRETDALSGGELQRLAIAAVVLKDADVYIFDEPSSFLDVKQRITASRVIRSILDPAEWDGDDGKALSKYVLVVEHDLAVLDYISDYICCLYGQPGAYGVVTQRMSVFNGINQFLAGYFEAENMRFRQEELTFKVSMEDEIDDPAAHEKGRPGIFDYPATTKVLSSEKSESTFTLHIEAGDFKEQEIIGLIGENGTGKTTFMQLLAGVFDEPAEGDEKPVRAAASLKDMGVSFKRQHNTQRFRRFGGTVRDLLERTINHALGDRMFRLLVMRPLSIEAMEDLNVTSLSGGELQRIAITICLGTPARVYLLDEPSAGLDCEQRVIVSKVIKRWVITHRQKTCFVIEHDFLMASTMFDRVIVYSGRPGIECTAQAPAGIVSGMNDFLKELDITFRRDPGNARPRINKHNSALDREQKAFGAYFLADEADMSRVDKDKKKEKTKKKQEEIKEDENVSNEKDAGPQWKDDY